MNENNISLMSGRVDGEIEIVERESKLLLSVETLVNLRDNLIILRKTEFRVVQTSI